MSYELLAVSYWLLAKTNGSSLPIAVFWNYREIQLGAANS